MRHRYSWLNGLVAAIVVLMLQGCAATGPRPSELPAAANAVPPGYGRLVFYRAAGFAGSAVQPDIKVDGQVVGQSRPGGFFHVDVGPGRHVVEVSTETTSRLEIETRAGQTGRQ